MAFRHRRAADPLPLVARPVLVILLPVAREQEALRRRPVEQRVRLRHLGLCHRPGDEPREDVERLGARRQRAVADDAGLRVLFEIRRPCRRSIARAARNSSAVRMPSNSFLAAVARARRGAAGAGGGRGAPAAAERGVRGEAAPLGPPGAKEPGDGAAAGDAVGGGGGTVPGTPPARLATPGVLGDTPAAGRHCCCCNAAANAACRTAAGVPEPGAPPPAAAAPPPGLARALDDASRPAVLRGVVDAAPCGADRGVAAPRGDARGDGAAPLGDVSGAVRDGGIAPPRRRSNFLCSAANSSSIAPRRARAGRRRRRRSGAAASHSLSPP